MLADLLTGGISAVLVIEDISDDNDVDNDVDTSLTEVVAQVTRNVDMPPQTFGAIDSSRTTVSCVVVTLDGVITDGGVDATSVEGEIVSREVSFVCVGELRTIKYLASLVPLRS